MIEFWGEGINYFDYKRLDLPVTRVYEGTNFGDDELINTARRAAWTNFVFVRSEGNNNAAMKNWNNPDPSDCYEVGVAGKIRPSYANRSEFAQKLTFRK